MRHGAPQVSTAERIRGDDFPDWLERYAASGIRPPKQDLPRLRKVFCSDLPRARQSAALIGALCVSLQDLCEAGLPAFQFGSLRLKAGVWVFIARLLWLAGLHRDAESPAAARRRAAGLAARLSCEAERDGEVVVVGHGYMNFLIGRALRRRGWRKVAARASGRHFGQCSFRLT
ncbi:histidine phosphatase family protein [Granulosicoccaceae sp. 1_MG-2023]|nr:histidine phosphatase family protein [Granulosicoccaceae sp. 1_MG-2023]